MARFWLSSATLLLQLHRLLPLHPLPLHPLRLLRLLLLPQHPLLLRLHPQLLQLPQLPLHLPLRQLLRAKHT